MYTSQNDSPAQAVTRSADLVHVLEGVHRVIDERVIERPAQDSEAAQPSRLRSGFGQLAMIPLGLAIGLLRLALWGTRMTFALAVLIGLVGGAAFLLAYGLVQFDGSLRWAGACGVLVIAGWTGGFTVAYIEALIERALSDR